MTNAGPVPAAARPAAPSVPRSPDAGGDAEVAVIGAGPAGCAAAVALARAGRRVVLLDRAPVARESVCGEFLGAEAAAALAGLGLDLPALGAVPLEGLRIASRAGDAAVPLPFGAWGLPRRRLDGALRRAAAAAGAAFRAASVLGAEAPGEGDGGGRAWRLRLAGGGEVRAGLVVLATGKHAFRGHPRRGAPPGALGLKLHLRGPFPGRETMLLPFDGGYAGLQPLPGGGAANLCAALHGPAAGEAARSSAALLARVAAGTPLGARLLGALEPAWARPLAVAGVPYGFRHRGGAGDPGTLYRVGDQAAVIPSFAGAGIAMALHSGLAAAAAILAGAEAGRFHAEWRRRAARPMRWAGAAAWMLRAAPFLTAAGAAASPAAVLLAARRTRIGA